MFLAGLNTGRRPLQTVAAHVQAFISSICENALELIACIRKTLSGFLLRINVSLFGFRHADAIGNNRIRLIRLPESTDSAYPSFTLETVPLASCPDYIALSYTWGPARASEAPYTLHDRRPVRLNGRVFPVYPNLHDALINVSAARPGQYLWVDSVCIDQRNKHERAAQIQIMDLVYRGAQETVVWLGLGSRKVERALPKLKAMAGGAEEKVLEWGARQTFGDVFIADDTSLLQKNGMPPMSVDDWLDLGDVFSRAWFGRAWMIQEVALSTNPVVLLGNQTISWDSVGHAAFMIGASNALVGLFAIGPGLQQIPLATGVSHAIRLQILREWCRGHSSAFREILPVSSADFSVGITDTTPSVALVRLLLGSSGFSASVPRDKIYALLGIYNFIARGQGVPSMTLEVDYHSSEETVLYRLGSQLFRQTQSLHLLPLAGEASRRTTSQLPSWIPAWDGVNTPIMAGFYSSIRPINACKAAPGFKPTFCIDDTLRRLQVQTASPDLGCIEEVGETFSELWAGKFMKCIRMLLHGGTIYPFTNQPIVEAFWRTLIMDWDMTHRPAPDHLADSFSDWIHLATLNALFANQPSNPFLHDLFNTLEPLFVLANSRDSTKKLPTSSTMLEAYFASYGISYGEKSQPESPEQRQAAVQKLAKGAATFEGLLKQSILPGRRLVRTVRGYLCLAPLQAIVGDRVMVVSGCPAPLVLRRMREEENVFKVIGDVYVHGAMFGEHVLDDCVWRNIWLV
ncbi:hypothetical protein S40285_02765 [Stachybotrys chlorohalonatus IBT 40285]|uniref:Heterokaryon incompatibility domain-containing protein n=1 Tax=Stachybotrys chlorohalonatus (strain IBT 40285) TaxID=1283841 RepID=A0A084QAH2_STAC4|nr:hypothetical protein S40285_02765 [Stachybotrys chlorohalonata IBT 40285]